MNRILLNTASIDGGMIIKKGSGGGGTSKPKYTGHADVEGLKAIGWTDEDIAYYQENGVNWNEEDDQYHLVSDDNKALYGVITADNIKTYKDRIVYLPKIDTSNVTSMSSMFDDCYSLISIPQLNTSKVTSMTRMFEYCYSLVSVPPLDTAKVTSMTRMFNNCYSLTTVPQLDTSNVKSMDSMFNSCYSLVSIPQLDTSSVTNMNDMFINCFSLVGIPLLNTSNVIYIGAMFSSCRSLVGIPPLDISSVTFMSSIFNFCSSLVSINLKNAKLACELNYANLLSKESLLYLINNESATSAITITLAKYAYTRLANDVDVVAALTNHPNITLASA